MAKKEKDIHNNLMENSSSSIFDDIQQTAIGISNNTNKISSNDKIMNLQVSSKLHSILKLIAVKEEKKMNVLVDEMVISFIKERGLL